MCAFTVKKIFYSAIKMKIIVKFSSITRLTKFKIQAANLPCVSDKMSTKILQVALQEGNCELLERCLYEGTILTKDKWESLAIDDIFQHPNRGAIIGILLKNGFATDAKWMNGNNLLHLFTSDVNKEDEDGKTVAELLVSSGVSATEADNFGYTALHLSIRTKNKPLIRFLLMHSTNIINNPTPELPLHMAVVQADIEIINLFLHCGADIDVKDHCGKTALHVACYYHRDEIIKYLLQKGSCISAKDGTGATPLFILNSSKIECNDCSRAMILEFSKMKFDKLMIDDSDLYLTQQNQKHTELFEKCISELNEMAITIVSGSHTLYSVLKMSKNMKKLVKFIKNDNNIKNIKKNAMKLTYYKNDLNSILAEAIFLKESLQSIYDELNKIFYKYLPATILTKLSEILLIKMNE